jgi:hypothetical protein
MSATEQNDPKDTVFIHRGFCVRSQVSTRQEQVGTLLGMQSMIATVSALLAGLLFACMIVVGTADIFFSEPLGPGYQDFEPIGTDIINPHRNVAWNYARWSLVSPSAACARRWSPL